MAMVLKRLVRSSQPAGQTLLAPEWAARLHACVDLGNMLSFLNGSVGVPYVAFSVPLRSSGYLTQKVAASGERGGSVSYAQASTHAPRQLIDITALTLFGVGFIGSAAGATTQVLASTANLNGPTYVADIIFNRTTGTIQARLYKGSTVTIDSGVVFEYGRVYRVALTAKSGSAELYVDGVRTATDASAGWVTSTAFRDLCLGNSEYDFQRLNGAVMLGGFTRTFSSADARSLSANPWQVLRAAEEVAVPVIGPRPAIPLQVMRERRRSQPRRDVPIDLGHPLARSLASYLPMAGQSWRDNATPGRVWTRAGADSLTNVSGPKGSGVNFGISAGGSYASTPWSQSLNTPHSISFWYRPNDIVGTSIGLVSADSTGVTGPVSSGPHFILARNAAALRAYVGGTYIATTGNVLTAGKTHHIVWTYDGSTGKIYVDGVEQGSASGYSFVGTPQTLFVGSGYANCCSGAMQDFALWSGRTLTRAEVAQHYAAPWDVLLPESVAYSTPGATGGATTATSDLSATYAVKSTATSDSAATYAIRSAVSADLGASFVVRTSAQADASASFIVLGSASADAVASFVVRASAQSDAAAAFAIRTTAQADAAASFVIRGSASSDAAATYAVRTSAAADLAAAFVVGSASVTTDLPTSYAIRGSATSDSAASYAVRGSASSDSVATFAIRTSAQADRAASFVVLGAAQADAAASYAIRTAASSDLAGAFSILNAGVVVTDLGASFSIRGAAQSDAAAAFSIRTSAETDRSAAYAVRGAAQTDLVGAYDIINALAVSADLSATWTVTGSILRDLFASYAVGEVLAEASPGFTAGGAGAPLVARFAPPTFRGN